MAGVRLLLAASIVHQTTVRFGSAAHCRNRRIPSYSLRAPVPLCAGFDLMGRHAARHDVGMGRRKRGGIARRGKPMDAGQCSSHRSRNLSVLTLRAITPSTKGSIASSAPEKTLSSGSCSTVSRGNDSRSTAFAVGAVSGRPKAGTPSVGSSSSDEIDALRAVATQTDGLHEGCDSHTTDSTLHVMRIFAVSQHVQVKQEGLHKRLQVKQMPQVR